VPPNAVTLMRSAIFARYRADKKHCFVQVYKNAKKHVKQLSDEK
jgi:hypothetical protein